MNKISILIFFMFLGYWAQAQLIEKKELEFEVSASLSTDDLNLIPLDTLGFLVLNNQDDFMGRNTQIKLFKYNTELEKSWELTNKIADDFKLYKYYTNREFIYLLFISKDDKKFNVIKVEIASGEYSVYESEFLTKMSIDFFAEIDNRYLITGEYNDKPVAELHKVFDKSAKVLPQVFSKNVKINALEIDQNLIYLMLKEDISCQFSMMVFNSDGKLQYTKKLGDKKKMILNAKILKNTGANTLLVGNYSDYCTDFSSGFYISDLRDSTQIKYYAFADLKNNLSHLSKKRQAYIQKRTNLKKLKGKSINRRFRVNLQEPLLLNDEIMIVAEVYFAEYKNNVYTSRPSLSHYSDNFSVKNEYNNYRYTNAILCLFDKKGNLKWDYSLNLGSLETETMSKKVQVSVKDDEIIAVYPKEDLLKLSTIKKGEEAKTGIPTSFKDKKDGNITDVTVDLFSWYDNNFLAYGYKTARLNGDFMSKDFFFVKKLSYTKELIKK